MKPEKIGRTLGIGLRLAGRMAGERITASAQAAGNSTHPVAEIARQTQLAKEDAKHAAGEMAGQAARGAARGLGGFLRPFGRVGGIVWLEVTGLFFLIFVPVFIGRGMWPIRADYAHGPAHMRFLAYAGLTLVFLYLGVSSFWRARKR